MIKCGECRSYQKPIPETLPDGRTVNPPPDALGHCRFFPPVPVIEHSAAVFGAVQVGSPLAADGGVVPGWRVIPTAYATYPVVKEDWGCEQGRLKESLGPQVVPFGDAAYGKE